MGKVAEGWARTSCMLLKPVLTGGRRRRNLPPTSLLVCAFHFGQNCEESDELGTGKGRKNPLPQAGD